MSTGATAGGGAGFTAGGDVGGTAGSYRDVRDVVDYSIAVSDDQTVEYSVDLGGS